MKRAIREHARDFAAIIALFVVAILTVGVIFSEQGLKLPNWVPLVGSSQFELKAELSSGQALTPGQGQSVNIAGIKIGDISAVDLESGVAVVSMEIDPKYSDLIHKDASILVRPRTGLNDMTFELDPGKPSSPTITEGATIPLANTQPNVQPDQVLASLDGDTQGFIKLLVDSGAQGIGGKGRQLSSLLRRLDPTARDIARINGALIKRRKNIARVIHNFGLISEQLASHDRQLADFVTSSNDVLGSFAKEEAAIRQSLVELPSTLKTTRSALTSGQTFAETAGPAFTALRPSARSLGPALEATRPFFRNTVGPIRTEIRPFARKVQPVIRALNAGSKPLQKAATGLKGGFTHLNRLLNALSYNPPGTEEGYLFWLAWLNHNGASTLTTSDSSGPLVRGTVLLTCSAATLAESLTLSRPFLNTLRQLTNPPSSSTIISKGGCN
jgi:phospholipid/cholesterol/gamma-HCH transport system substrate-binding protein